MAWKRVNPVNVGVRCSGAELQEAGIDAEGFIPVASTCRYR